MVRPDPVMTSLIKIRNLRMMYLNNLGQRKPKSGKEIVVTFSFVIFRVKRTKFEKFDWPRNEQTSSCPNRKAEYLGK